jgi:hypothetical protein
MEFRGEETQTREERKSSEAALGQRGRTRGARERVKAIARVRERGSGKDGSREQTERGEKMTEAINAI